jgi:hypothetical protein
MPITDQIFFLPFQYKILFAANPLSQGIYMGVSDYPLGVENVIMLKNWI